MCKKRCYNGVFCENFFTKCKDIGKMNKKFMLKI